MDLDFLNSPVGALGFTLGAMKENYIISVLAPLPRERGWGEAGNKRIEGMGS